MNIEFMNLALIEAQGAFRRNCIPVGAAVVKDEKLICSASNEDGAIFHAELMAITEAIHVLGCNFLNGCDLYVTLEPCAMCAQAISLARIENLYFGAYDTKYGAVVNNARIFQYALHKPNVVGGIMEPKCSEILQKFFKNKRKPL